LIRPAHGARIIERRRLHGGYFFAPAGRMQARNARCGGGVCAPRGVCAAGCVRGVPCVR
jgi:hypothetical protein